MTISDLASLEQELTDARKVWGTGRELFGVDTLKSNGAFAADGFDALRDLDSNHDGFITSADMLFGELKIWQDTNQDGISFLSRVMGRWVQPSAGLRRMR